MAPTEAVAFICHLLYDRDDRELKRSSRPEGERTARDRGGLHVWAALGEERICVRRWIRLTALLLALSLLVACDRETGGTIPQSTGPGRDAEETTEMDPGWEEAVTDYMIQLQEGPPPVSDRFPNAKVYDMSRGYPYTYALIVWEPAAGWQSSAEVAHPFEGAAAIPTDEEHVVVPFLLVVERLSTPDETSSFYMPGIGAGMDLIGNVYRYIPSQQEYVQLEEGETAAVSGGALVGYLELDVACLDADDMPMNEVLLGKMLYGSRFSHEVQEPKELVVGLDISQGDQRFDDVLLRSYLVSSLGGTAYYLEDATPFDKVSTHYARLENGDFSVSISLQVYNGARGGGRTLMHPEALDRADACFPTEKRENCCYLPFLMGVTHHAGEGREAPADVTVYVSGPAGRQPGAPTLLPAVCRDGGYQIESADHGGMAPQQAGEESIRPGHTAYSIGYYYLEWDTADTKRPEDADAGRSLREWFSTRPQEEHVLEYTFCLAGEGAPEKQWRYELRFGLDADGDIVAIELAPV